MNEGNGEGTWSRGAEWGLDGFPGEVSSKEWAGNLFGHSLALFIGAVKEQGSCCSQA